MIQQKLRRAARGKPRKVPAVCDATKCKAAIAVMMRQEPKIIAVKSQSDGVIQLSYERPSDGSKYSYLCKIDGSSVTWATDPDGRWHTDQDDEKIAFSVSGDYVTIKRKFSTGSSADRIFKVSDL